MDKYLSDTGTRKEFFLKLEKTRLIRAAPTPKRIANIIENNP
jgi:hypothetical protein